MKTNEQAERKNEGIAHLLKALGAEWKENECRGCGATILMVQHKNGKWGPYDLDGTTHFATCPQADRFKRKG